MISPQHLLREKGIRPSKALGQNFLIHEESAEKIVRWAGITQDQTVLEIGPGLGAMTEALHQASRRVIAIERDPQLFELLSERWKGEPWLRLIHGDALETNFESLSKEENTTFQVVANLPYSISTPILEKLLFHSRAFTQMVLLFQEEVVDRITAEVGSRDYSRLTIWLQMLCEVERGPKITKGSFYPVPEIESRLVRITPLATPRVPIQEIDSFLKVVALIFQHRRKTVRNALKDSKQEGWDVEKSLDKTKIDGGRRPQTLTIEELFKLSKHLNQI